VIVKNFMHDWNDCNCYQSDSAYDQAGQKRETPYCHKITTQNIALSTSPILDKGYRLLTVFKLQVKSSFSHSKKAILLYQERFQTDFKLDHKKSLKDNCFPFAYFHHLAVATMISLINNLQSIMAKQQHVGK
jgi:hypothetical protein